METSESEKEDLTITFGMVQGIVKLSKLQIRNVFAALDKPVPGKDDTVSDEEIAILIFADLLERIPFLQPEQRTLLLEEVGPLAAGTPAATQLNQFVIGDGRFAVWTGYQGFLDLETGENLPEPPAMFAHSISYNLNETLRREIERLHKRSGAYVKRQNADGNVEESPDFRDRPDYGFSG
jgi:hypothetical protein